MLKCNEINELIEQRKKKNQTQHLYKVDHIINNMIKNVINNISSAPTN